MDTVPQITTMEEFKNLHRKSKESLMDIAWAAQGITDDAEFSSLANKLILLEDEFLKEFNKRGMVLN